MISRALREAGEQTAALKAEARKWREQRFATLHAEGMGDRGIATATGSTAKTVRGWRQRNGLPAIKGWTDGWRE